MLYKKLTLEDVPRIKPYFDVIQTGSCDYTIGGMFMWRDYYHMEYAIEDGVFFSRLYGKDGNCYYNIPIGVDLQKAVDLMLKQEKKIAFCTIPDTMLDVFRALNKKITIREQQDYADYLYEADDLIGLKGKKFNGQRNQIHQFLRDNEDWNYAPMTDADLPEALAFLTTEYKVPEDANDFEIEEEEKVLDVVKNYGRYGLIGGVLRVRGVLVGLSIGEVIGDTLFVHVEKATRSIKGGYQMLVNLFAKQYAGGHVRFVNREEDMGDPGLRVAKRAYHPIRLINKYIVEVES